MRKKNEHSEEYNKGYRVGYNAGYAKGKGHPKAEKGLFDLTRVRPIVHWETIEGDWETFSCPVCHHSFYSENCGSDNRPRVLDEAIDGEGKDGNVREGDTHDGKRT